MQQDEFMRRVAVKKQSGEWFAEMKVRIEMAKEQQEESMNKMAQSNGAVATTTDKKVFIILQYCSSNKKLAKL